VRERSVADVWDSYRLTRLLVYRPLAHSVRYTEAWIEFLNKSVAKSAAEMLNAQPIGGAKGEK
jgi:hypothetical protein